ncbi:hypothetical protein APF79_10915 [bacterium BRH_c32]|nr:MAG: hypothetical protein APF79_10915 [bacterium BRH_c32]
MNRRRIDWLLFLLITIWYCGIFFNLILLIYPPLVYTFPLVNLLYSLVCHQNPEKLITIYSGHTLVCARCTGIYSGVLLMSLISLIEPKINIESRKLFYISVIILLFDVLMTTFKIYDYSKLVAFTTGIFFGGVMFLYFRSALYKLFIITEAH